MGCRLNQIESEAIANVFLNNNLTVSMQNITAEYQENSSVLLCIVNTCTVTQKSEQKARRVIRLLLKKFPKALLIITGCYAQLASKEIESIDERICVIGGQIKSRIAKIPELLNKEIQGKNNFNPVEFSKIIKSSILSVPQIKNGFPENSFSLSTSTFLTHSRPSLKIQDGCNNNCSYCAIHFARGHSVSIDVQTALDRVKELEEKGYSEVVLTSVNILQYRSEYKGEVINFCKLLSLLLENTSSICFRISSIYPQIINDEFCEVIKNERVRPHFHISVQSGSNKILKLMNRDYTAEDIVKACNAIRKVKPESFIACDIITGFPAESDEDFERTMQLCRDCNFSWVHAFPFSLRPGTYACELKDKVPQSISGMRAKRLTEWAIENKINNLSTFVSKQMTAVPEVVRNRAIGGNIYHAVTPNFIHCEIKTTEQLDLTKEIKIKITDILAERIKKGGDIEVSAELVK